MTKITKTRIVENDEILTDVEISLLVINEQYLENIFCNNQTANAFLAKIKLIPNERKCYWCFGASYKDMRYTVCSESVDGFKWQCTKPCRKSILLRSGTIFEGSRISTRLIIKIIYKYVCGIPYVDISYDLSISRQTAGFWAELVRECMIKDLDLGSRMIGGVSNDGVRKVVEIDESLFFKRKYNKGRVNNGTWYVGGIERGTREAFMLPVENRNTETMVRILMQHVLPGTTVITDKWAAYKKAMDEMNMYEHKVINHSINFVDPLDPTTHTQNIEGLWSRSKFFIRKRSGLHQDQHFEFLLQFIWEYKIEKRKRINSLLGLLQFN